MVKFIHLPGVPPYRGIFIIIEKLVIIEFLLNCVYARPKP